MFCRRCGSKIPEGALFCPNCGLKVENTVPQPQTVAPAQPTQEMPKQESVTESTPEETVQTEQSTPKTEEKPVEQDDSSQVNVKVDTPAQESPMENTPAQSGQPQSPIPVSQTNQPNEQVLFCRRCGTKIPNGADFCPNCGFSVHGATPPPQATQPNPMPKKKNRLPLAIVSVVAMVVAIVAVVIFNGRLDYKETIRGYSPFSEETYELTSSLVSSTADTEEVSANEQDYMPYTCGEVFNKFIENQKWNVEKEDKAADVEIQGKAKGTDQTISILFETKQLPEDYVFIELKSLKFGEEELGDDGFLALFKSYDQDEEDLSTYDILMDEIDLSQTGEFTETFSDEESGISFNYPEFWVVDENKNQNEIVSVSSPRNNENHLALLKVEASSDVWGVFSGDEETVSQAVNDKYGQDSFILYVSDGYQNGDTPVTVVNYFIPGSDGEKEWVEEVWHRVGDKTYVTSLVCSDSFAYPYLNLFATLSDTLVIQAPLSPIAAAMEEYKTILRQPETYGHGDEINSVEYQYALVQMQKDDSIPSLLLESMDQSYSMFIFLFHYDTEQGKAIELTEGITDCILLGPRTGLSIESDGDGLALSSVSMGGEMSVDRISLDGNTLVQETQWSGFLGDGNDNGVKTEEIEWHEIDDLSALEEMAGVDESSSTSGSTTVNDMVEKGKSANLYVDGYPLRDLLNFDKNEVINTFGSPAIHQDAIEYEGEGQLEYVVYGSYDSEYVEISFFPTGEVFSVRGSPWLFSYGDQSLDTGVAEISEILGVNEDYVTVMTNVYAYQWTVEDIVLNRPSEGSGSGISASFDY